MELKLIIAGSRTVDPTDDIITAEVLKLPPFREIPGSHREISPGISGISSLSVQEPTVLIQQVISHVICGESPGGGADEAGKRWAGSHGIPVISEPITDEDYRQWGRYVGPKMRNRRMAEQGDLALVFWDGQSNGSTDLVTRMVLRRKHVEVVPSKPVRRRRARPAQARVAEERGDKFVRADGSSATAPG